MTFNIRFENDRDGQNAWAYRKDLVVRIIDRYKPDIIGTQEGRWNQLLYLRDNLPAYLLHAPNRTVDSVSQYPTLFVRGEDFEITGGGEFWLSKTPEIHRSKDWDSAFPRMFNHAEVLVRRSGEKLRVAVTHLDNKGAEARYEQAGIIAAWVKEQRGPVALMGDFNDIPGSRVHQLLGSEEIGLQDTWQVLDRELGVNGFTHHGFKGIPQDGRIDWILVSRHLRVLDAVVLHDHFNGRYPSDHFPYMVDLDLTQQQQTHPSPSAISSTE